jgi:hypothetical protein
MQLYNPPAACHAAVYVEKIPDGVDVAAADVRERVHCPDDQSHTAGAGAEPK